MPSNSVCNHTRDEQIGLPLRGRPILLSLVWLQTELDSTHSYYHYISNDISTNLSVDISFIDRSSVGRVSTDVSTDIYIPISTNTLGEVSVNRQIYRPIGVSVDTSVDTPPIYRPTLDRVSTDASVDMEAFFTFKRNEAKNKEIFHQNIHARRE